MRQIKYRPQAALQPLKRVSLSKLVLCLLSLLLLSCQAQIRHARKIRQDPFLNYLSRKYQTWEAKKILQDLEKNTEKEKKLPSCQHDRAMVLTHSLAWDQAETLWKANLEKSPQFLANYLSLSRLYLLLEEEEALRQLYSQWVQNKKIPQSKLYALAQKLYQQGRAKEAVLLMQSLERGRKIEKAERSGKIDKIEGPANDLNCYRQSCYLPASLWLAEYYLAEPNYKQSYFYYRRILKRKAHHLQALWGLAKLAYLAKEWKQAVAYLQLVQSQKKTSPKIQRESYYLLAHAYFQEKEISKALRQIEKISKREHNYASLSLYGDILLTQNFQADLSSVLRLTNSESLRFSLLRHWYGLEKIKGLKQVHSSFSL